MSRECQIQLLWSPDCVVGALRPPVYNEGSVDWNCRERMTATSTKTLHERASPCTGSNLALPRLARTDRDRISVRFPAVPLTPS